jgi:hypothetical protein
MNISLDELGNYMVYRRTFSKEALLGASLTKLRVEEKEKYTV